MSAAPEWEVRYDPTNLTVGLYVRGNIRYEIDLERLTTAEQFSEWVSHISAKAWPDEWLAAVVRVLSFVTGWAWYTPDHFLTEPLSVTPKTIADTPRSMSMTGVELMSESLPQYGTAAEVMAMHQGAAS